MPEPSLDLTAAAAVHYPDPRVRALAFARWNMNTSGTFMEWLALDKNDPDTLIREAREWLRAVVALGLLPLVETSTGLARSSVPLDVDQNGNPPRHDEDAVRRIADTLARHYDGQMLTELRDEHATHHLEAAAKLLPVPVAEPAPRPSSVNVTPADRLECIAQAHAKEITASGMTSGLCVECEHLWPCPSYVWATTDRDPLATWDPADDEQGEEPDADGAVTSSRRFLPAEDHS
ncbi:hypothetical protein ACWEFD_31765 [Streptomyces ardesiacus]